MKYIKNLILTVSGIAVAMGVSSCNSFLDMTPTDSVSDKMLWKTTANAEYGVNYIYSYILDMADANSGQCAAGMTDALTDQLKYGSYNFNALCYIPSEIAYGGSVLTANYVSAYLGYWDTMYSAIRKTNQGLNYLEKYGEMSGEDKTRLSAELRFMRAWFYFDLVKRYKDVIIYDEDLSAITANKALSTEEEGWNFIESDLEFAAANLPEKEKANGRLNKGTAYAFMTRAMLYAKRYDKVVAAAAKVKELGYSLISNYADVFNGNNSEVILEYVFNYSDNVTHSFDYYYSPGGDYTTKDASGGGYGTPTQEIVESYEYADGSGLPDWSPWHTAEGTDQNPRMSCLSLVSRRPYSTTVRSGKGARSSRLWAETTAGANGTWSRSLRVRRPRAITSAKVWTRRMT